MCRKSNVSSCVNAARLLGSDVSPFSLNPNFFKFTKFPISFGNAVNLFLYKNNSVNCTKSRIDDGMLTIYKKKIISKQTCTKFFNNFYVNELVVIIFFYCHFTSNSVWRMWKVNELAIHTFNYRWTQVISYLFMQNQYFNTIKMYSSVISFKFQ